VIDKFSDDGAVIASLRLEVRNARILHSQLRDRERSYETMIRQQREEIHRIQTRCESLEEKLSQALAERR